MNSAVENSLTRANAAAASGVVVVNPPRSFLTKNAMKLKIALVMIVVIFAYVTFSRLNKQKKAAAAAVATKAPGGNGSPPEK